MFDMSSPYLVLHMSSCCVQTDISTHEVSQVAPSFVISTTSWCMTKFQRDIPPCEWARPLKLHSSMTLSRLNGRGVYHMCVHTSHSVHHAWHTYMCKQCV